MRGNLDKMRGKILGYNTIYLGIKSLSVFGDSTLVISQIKGEWDTKHPNLIPYKEHVLTLIPHFEEITARIKSTSGRASHHVIHV